MTGTQTAYAWVRCGYRTLDDLRAVESSLTRSQRIGLKYYDELLDRMPRSEAAEIEATVVTAHTKYTQQTLLCAPPRGAATWQI